MTKAEDLARRWMPGTRQGPMARPAWEHPHDIVKLLNELLGPEPEIEPYNAAVSLLDGPMVFEKELDTWGMMIRSGARMQLIEIAWLHDILEDGIKEDGHLVTWETLCDEGISLRVIKAVASLSKRADEEKPIYLARLSGALPEAKLVKVVDRICNLREGKDSFKDKRWARYVDESQRYIMPLIEDIEQVELRPTLRAMLQEAMDARPVVLGLP